MPDYLTKHGTLETPQTEPVSPDQVENSAGGYVWSVDDVTRVRRFLILGSEGGSYYADERKLTAENAVAVRRLATTDGEALVREIVAVSETGRAPSNDPALFALACAISVGDAATRRAAAEALPRVARIGTHLFHFAAYVETMRGWGRTLRWAVANWYEQKPVDALAYDAVKYRQRDGWSHRDLLRLAHPAGSVEHGRLYSAIVGGFETTTAAGETRPYLNGTPLVPDVVHGFVRAQRSSAPALTANLVRDYRLPREALLPDHLTDPLVWRSLLDVGMPITALVRNLANMTRLGVLEGDHRRLAVETLADETAIRSSRIHPLALLVALRTYASGRSLRGSNTWTPIPAIIDALDAAFYTAFGNVEPTGKRHLLAVDVSPSMAVGFVAGSPLTPREASVAMALVTLTVEPDCEVVCFAGHELRPLGLSTRQRLDDAVRSVTGIDWSRTDCALPMTWATRHARAYDAFVVYTDSETFAGHLHPSHALALYRRESVSDARLAVVGMVSNGFSIADPADRGMLDVVGFDTATPTLVSEFVAGRI